LDLVGEDLDRALIVADQMAGAVDHALRVGDRFPDNGHGGWSAVAEEMVRTPIFQAIVQEKPLDFPDLNKYFPKHSSSPALPPAQRDGEVSGFSPDRRDSDTA
jgi:hypothetical protein